MISNEFVGKTLFYPVFVESVSSLCVLVQTYRYNLKVFDFLSMAQRQNKCPRVTLTVPDQKHPEKRQTNDFI